MAKDKALVGVAGVHHVAFQLSARGYPVGLVAPGVRTVDLLASNPSTGRLVDIQVKTMTNAAQGTKKKGISWWGWRIGKLADAAPRENFLFAFVDLRGGFPLNEAYEASWTPDVFIVPSIHLKSVTDPPETKDRWCVISRDNAPKYKNNWKLLEDALGKVE